VNTSRTALAAVCLLAAAGLAGCSSSPHKAQTLTTQAASTPAASTPSAMAAANLKSDLLAIADMPAGWSTTGSTSDGSHATASCPAINSRAWQQLPSNAEADFSDGSMGPFLTEKLAAGTVAQTTAAWQAFSKATTQCATFSAPTSGGGTEKFQLAALSFPSYGDQTYAIALTLTASSGLSASGDIVVVRKGGVLVQVIAVGLESVPVTTVEDAVSKAVAKA
jgi:hypothetical protein